MEVTVKKTGLEVIIQGKYTQNDKESLTNTIAKKLSKTVKLPGFRAGKVPVRL